MREEVDEENAPSVIVRTARRWLVVRIGRVSPDRYSGPMIGSVLHARRRVDPLVDLMLVAAYRTRTLPGQA